MSGRSQAHPIPIVSVASSFLSKGDSPCAVLFLPSSLP